MWSPIKPAHPRDSSVPTLLTYVADLELEVDRLRRQGQFVRQEMKETLRRILQRCTLRAVEAKGSEPLADIRKDAEQLAAMLAELQEPPGYHPAHDQVVPIAVRPLIEQVFRWQQRLVGATEVGL